MSSIKFLLAILVIFSLNIPSEAFNLDRPHTQWENTKPPKNISDDEMPDILVPETEIEGQAEKTENEKLEKIKHSFKKLNITNDKYVKNKKLKKYKYGKIKRENKAPITYEQYLEMVKEVKREDRKVPQSSFKKDDKLVNLPEPELRLAKYNNPPGAKNLDLRQLMKSHQLVTPAVLSPDKTKMVYPVVYSYPTAGQVASEVFVINVPSNTDAVSALRNMHTIEADRNPVLKTGTDRFAQYEKKTFTILDWSEDGQKIAVKEKIGAIDQGPWKTQIWTYDFTEKKACELTALREAIRYYWKKNHNLDLIDYMWDIYPLGWDMYNKDRIVVQAYAFGKNHSGSKFLGTWSIDYRNQRSELMSETAMDFDVSINGFYLEVNHHK